MVSMTTRKTPRRKADRSAYGPERKKLIVELGHLLKHVREDRAMTTRGLAHMAGVPQSTIMRYEYGDREPRIYNLVRIMRALDATDQISDFLVASAKILPKPPAPLDNN
jgi:transcriptional regulator with XRE-family HTH domain